MKPLVLRRLARKALQPMHALPQNIGKIAPTVVNLAWLEIIARAYLQWQAQALLPASLLAPQAAIPWAARTNARSVS